MSRRNSLQTSQPFLKAACISACVLMSGLAPVTAAELGDPAAGRKYADQICASCHNVAPDGRVSPDMKATPFQVIANSPGFGRTALVVFLRTPHTDMPNLIVEGDNADNVISYILSLKKKAD